MSIETLPLQREPAPGLSLTGQLLLFGLLIVVLALSWWLRRRRAGADMRSWKGWLGAQVTASQPIELLHAQRLTPGVTLHAVRWGGEELLLACTGQGVTVVSRRPAAQPAAAPPDEARP